MYVVTVTFTARPGHAEALKSRVVQQAAETLANEPACRTFDVCFDPEDELSVFLYEVYDTPEDFLTHLESPHFRDFDAATALWVAEKVVRSWRRL